MTNACSLAGGCRTSTPRFVAVTVLVLALINFAGCTTMHDAAAHGDLQKGTALLKDNPDLVFKKDAEGKTPLHVAAPTVFKDVVALLLANHADVNAKENVGATPLHYAARRCSLFFAVDRSTNLPVAELLLAN